VLPEIIYVYKALKRGNSVSSEKFNCQVLGLTLNTDAGFHLIHACILYSVTGPLYLGSVDYYKFANENAS
jgi:hypothetical protein